MHYDLYGHGKPLFEAEGNKRYFDTTVRGRENRYLLWVSNGEGSKSFTGQRKTYRSSLAAIRKAKRLARKGYGVRVVDRRIRLDDWGFLADRTGSYYREPNGKLHTGSLDYIQSILRERGARR